MSIITSRGVLGTGGAKLRDVLQLAGGLEFRAASRPNGYDGVVTRVVMPGLNQD